MTSENTGVPAAADVTGVSLIVPVFNSEASLPLLIESVAELRHCSDFEFELVLVDDASSDGSVAVLRRLQRRVDNVVVVELPVNRGQSKATLAGISAARHDVIVLLDDDLQYRPQDVPNLLRPFMVAGPSTLVMGLADSIKRPLWRALAGSSCNVISNLFLSRPLPLRLTTFCAFNRKLVGSIDAGPNGSLALITELVQASSRTLTVKVKSNSSVQRVSRYTIAALVALFLSRSRCYSLDRVLLWLAGSASIMAASASLFALRGGLGYAFVCLASATCSSLLAWLAISVRRQALSTG